MVVGVVELELLIPGCCSLKAKRSVVKRVINRTRSHFNVTIAEVEKQDVYSRGVVGCAMIGSDRRYVNGALDKLIDFVEKLSLAEILEARIEIVTF
jgi:uncharacterized protein YlxP (DUF503 family)